MGRRAKMHGENEMSNDTSIKEKFKNTSCCTWIFPWFFIYSLSRLIIYLYKIYQDCYAVSTYYRGGDINYCIISIFCFLVPAFSYVVYLIFANIIQEEKVKITTAITNIIYGLLLIPWQIKSILEVLGFSTQRICQRKGLSEDEKKEYNLIEHQAMVLEFFEDFFAGFIQLALQLYIIIMSLDDPSFNSKILKEEIISSSLIIISMITAVRRKDDGWLTTFFSFIGWTLIATSRTLIIALTATIIHGGIVGLCLFHALIITIWLVPICWRSYTETELSNKKKLSIIFIIYVIFGLPSLIFWPILFQLKENKRPFIFMVIIGLENIALFCIWYFLRENKQWTINNTYFTAVIGGGSVIGFIFIMLYIFIKPKYTDQIVLHDMKVENASSFGMYFEFCDAAFNLPVSQWINLNLQQIRQS
ncbi:uncharacterized protein LOC111630116 [Centruroides sculpturatus]|uniref:uncharacterized protein LOC111630116 n=1 Tax=Centruroides sculpturatus TaxID=218467 RepID=UPI000C6CFF0D|nr:uncharacterized protein LOC111630116 [Centruroides sculpturatus]XP_023229908.1 uncharacterized protein LOC111630116 [Centruroides sculpturatus]XP_023229909.1 uncharacterized protein LOC111630116 [Centruroides sculpturatus]XP_023229910.1 uncharacterized protein LOC111630116 [Centruroides sculpturatus]